MKGLRVLEAHAAHHGLRQDEGEHAHEQPLREVQRARHGPAAERFEHGGMVRLDGVHNVLIPAACGQNAGSEHGDAHEHDDAAQRVGKRHAAETADGGEQDDRRAEEHEADHV